jgi:PP-loop superfamily ATP-utilizing enzyme
LAIAENSEIDYPHAIEHDGRLLVAFSGGKQSVEVLKIRPVDLK